MLPRVARLLVTDLEAIVAESDVLIVAKKQLQEQVYPALLRDGQVVIELAQAGDGVWCARQVSRGERAMRLLILTYRVPAYTHTADRNVIYDLVKHFSFSKRHEVSLMPIATERSADQSTDVMQPFCVRTGARQHNAAWIRRYWYEERRSIVGGLPSWDE